MDKTIFYTILDIDSADEFNFYENFASLMEADEYIESNLIKDLLSEVDLESFADLMDSYFEELLKMLPDKETDLYITVDSIKRALCGMIDSGAAQDEIGILAEELQRVRKWFVHDLLAFDMKTAEELSVRDAIYNIAAAKYLNKEADYDFRLACNFEVDGYDVRVSDMIEGVIEDDQDC